MGPERILFLLIVILVIVIIWRGPKTLPLIGRAFGQGVKEARREMNEIKADMEKKTDDGVGTSGTSGTGGTPGAPGGTPPS
jgi:TatA/E family protein of Tat protein translocase